MALLVTSLSGGAITGRSFVLSNSGAAAHGGGAVSAALPSMQASRSSSCASIGRRTLLCTAALAILPPPTAVHARTPGSSDVGEAIEQIVAGSDALRKLQQDWSTYACIDAEGRACNIDSARKILGGVAPQRGEAAIEVAKATPLYRMDGAFAAVRKYVLSAEDVSWATNLDIEDFVQRGEDIVFNLKRADDSFYSVVFASKGSSMLEKIYKEAKDSVDVSVRDFDAMIGALRAAKAPGV